MTMPTVLLTGVSSLPGYQTAIHLLRLGYQVVGIYFKNKIRLDHQNFKLKKADITNPGLITKLVKKIQPEVIVHMAALGNVDLCETEKKLAWRTNTLASAHLARLASRYSPQFLYLSTDFVFPGKDGNYRELDPPNPINYYGLSKLGGEIATLSSNTTWAVVRASSIYGFGPGRKNFAKFLVERLSQGLKVGALVDQYTTPTQASLLAKAVCEIIERKLCGFFHVVGERMSRYEFAIKVASTLGFDRSLIQKAYVKDMKWVAKRPIDSSLNCERTRKLLKTKFYSSSIAFRVLKEEYQAVIKTPKAN